MRSQQEVAATIAVCTANRQSRLAETLAAVLPLIETQACELLVVDNGSTDGTPRLLAELAAAHRENRRTQGGEAGGFRAVREERLGLSAARNRAVREARGELILFLDDDALPVAGWIEAYLTAFLSPAVAAAGGPVEPIFDGALPLWMDERFLPYLSVWDRGTQVVPLSYNELPRGANMAIRRSSFTIFGDFLEQLGRKGNSLRSCEEIEYFLRLERAGESIVYLPNAGVRHHVATQRLSEEWMGARFAAQGFSEAILDWRHAGARGLSVGLRRVAKLDSQPDGGALSRCLAHARKGYRRGAFYAAFAVAQYQPAAPVALARFEPPI